MESKSGNSITSTQTQQFPILTNLNVKLTPEIFNGTNYRDWAYSTKMAIGGSRRLGCIDGSIKVTTKEDPKYSDWVSENMSVMNWILNSMVSGIAKEEFFQEFR